jgi:hypothetical protein
MPSATAARIAETAIRALRAMAAPAPVSTPAAMSNGRAQQAAQASAARAPATLLRVGGVLSIVVGVGGLVVGDLVDGQAHGRVPSRWLMLMKGMRQSAQVQLVRLSHSAVTTWASASRIAVRSAILASVSVILSMALAKSGRGMAAPAGLDELGDLVEGEAEPLGGFDNAEQGDGVGGVDAVAADAALRLGEQAAAFVNPPGVWHARPLICPVVWFSWLRRTTRERCWCRSTRPGSRMSYCRRRRENRCK